LEGTSEHARPGVRTSLRGRRVLGGLDPDLCNSLLERTRDGNYPHTICGVVYDGVRPGRIDCQFTYACDGSIARPKRLAAWTRVKLLAEGIVSGTVKLVNSTGHAVAYHNTSVTPAWSGTMEKTTQIGNHIFYRWSSRSLPVRATQDEVAARR